MADLVRDGFVCGCSEVAKVTRKLEVILGFAGRAVRDIDKAIQFGVAVTSATFGEVSGNRCTRTAELAGEPEEFLFREVFGHGVVGQREFVTALPHFELVVVFHCEAEES